MPMPFSHFVPAYPSPSLYPQVHSLVGLHLYSRLAPRFFWPFFFLSFFFRFHIYVIAYSICSSLSDLLHSVWQSLGPSTSLQITQFRSFLSATWLSGSSAGFCCGHSFSCWVSQDSWDKWAPLSAWSFLSRELERACSHGGSGFKKENPTPTCLSSLCLLHTSWCPTGQSKSHDEDQGPHGRGLHWAWIPDSLIHWGTIYETIHHTVFSEVLSLHNVVLFFILLSLITWHGIWLWYFPVAHFHVILVFLNLYKMVWLRVAFLTDLPLLLFKWRVTSQGSLLPGISLPTSVWTSSFFGLRGSLPAQFWFHSQQFLPGIFPRWELWLDWLERFCVSDSPAPAKLTKGPFHSPEMGLDKSLPVSAAILRLGSSASQSMSAHYFGVPCPLVHHRLCCFFLCFLLYRNHCHGGLVTVAGLFPPAYSLGSGGTTLLCSKYCPWFLV